MPVVLRNVRHLEQMKQHCPRLMRSIVVQHNSYFWHLLAWILMTGLTFGKQLQESEGHSKLLYMLYCLCIHVE